MCGACDLCACYFIWDRPGVSVSGWVSTLGVSVSVGEHIGSPCECG